MNFKQFSLLPFFRFKYSLRLPKELLLIVPFLCFSLIILSAQISFIQKPDITTNVSTIQSIDNNTIFAATFSNGLFKSIDGGASWSILDTAMTGLRIDEVFILDLNTIFIYSIGKGPLLKSTDGGTTFTNVNYPFSNPAINEIVALDANNIFITDGNYGVQKTTDGGANWTQIGGHPDIFRAGAIEVIDANNIFVGTGFDGVYKTTDGGTNWVQTNTGIADTAGIRGISLIDANTIFISVSDNFGENGGVFKSLNGGATWTEMNTGVSLSSPRIAALDANTIFVGDFSRTNGILRSTDGGTTWSAFSEGLTDRLTHSLHPIDSTNILVGTSGGLFFGMPPCMGVSEVSAPIPFCGEPANHAVFFTPFSSRSGEIIEVIDNNGLVINSDTISPIQIPDSNYTTTAKTFTIQYKNEPKCPIPFTVMCDMRPCNISNVSVAAPICGDSIIFEVSFTPIANRNDLILVMEGGNVVGTGTTSPIIINYPDTTTIGKSFSIQYAGTPNCATSFQVPGCNSCNPEDIVITKQSQIDSFQILYGSCDYVVGSLTIGDDKDGVDNITNLGGLLNLIQIGGNFICLDNPFLGTGNSGLRSFSTTFNLNAVGGEIIISGNPNLTGLNLIENVATVGGSVTITNNDALTTIGLENVETIGGAVNISDNDALTTIGLDDVETIGGSVTIADNSQLTNIDLFDNVETIAGSVTIEDNSSLTDFGNLPNVMINGTTNVDNNAGTVPVPSIADPCSCNDLLNIKTGTTITHFHDILTVTGTAGDQVTLVTGGANFLDNNLTQISNNTNLGTIPASGTFTFDFFHPSDAAGNIVVNVGGTNLAPFPVSVCSASACTEPIPTMSEWGLLIFGLLVLNLGVFFVQRKEWIL